MLTKEQRSQLFAATYNAFMQDLSRKTGFQLAAVIDISKESIALGLVRARLEPIPVEGWEPPEDDEPVLAPPPKPANSKVKP